METAQLPFGGHWTEDKLDRVRKYLDAYQQALKNQPFRRFYIDAFAGTGYNELKANPVPSEAVSLFPEFAEEETKQFIDGSARLALKVEPPFDRYVFIEKNVKRFADLELLKLEFPDREIDVRRAEANEYLDQICGHSWLARNERAVLFLDPFGMQVSWNTIAKIAATQAIDLWYLFPLGPVNRLLKRSGDIPENWSGRLDAVLGEHKWQELFFRTNVSLGLFGEEVVTEKAAGFEEIAKYFVGRLKTVFPGVAENPLVLFSNNNSPLYLLCFAASNPKGSSIAVRIAAHILGRPPRGKRK
jgi:three-Cys-motif partner protein